MSFTLVLVGTRRSAGYAGEDKFTAPSFCASFLRDSRESGPPACHADMHGLLSTYREKLQEALQYFHGLTELETLSSLFGRMFCSASWCCKLF